MRTWREALEWLRGHRTTRQIGFNPNGMCLKIARFARNIAARHLTAKQAQDATPREHRVYNVRDLRKGMFLYFDDPNDSNTAGHICTMIGRVKGFDPDSLHDVLVDTNSVIDGEMAIVRASYFGEHWKDKFQFGTRYLNGELVDVYQKPAPVPSSPNRQEKFADSRPNWNVNILDRAAEKDEVIRGKVRRIDEAVASLPDDPDDSLVSDFKKLYENERRLNLDLLAIAVREGGRTGEVKDVLHELRALVKSLLPRSS